MRDLAWLAANLAGPHDVKDSVKCMQLKAWILGQVPNLSHNYTGI